MGVESEPVSVTGFLGEIGRVVEREALRHGLLERRVHALARVGLTQEQMDITIRAAFTRQEDETLLERIEWVLRCCEMAYLDHPLIEPAPPLPGRNKAWTKDEDAELLARMKAGLDLQSVADAHQRTVLQVKNRLRKLEKKEAQLRAPDSPPAPAKERPVRKASRAR